MQNNSSPRSENRWLKKSAKMTKQKGSGNRSKKMSPQKGSDNMSEKQLEERLRKVGNELLQFPTQVDQLLSLLNKVGSLLAEVYQSPPELIQNAYSQCMKALLSEPLLRHTDADVQVAVAFCINEFTRITAPEAPYTDNQMKEVFKLLVSSFENLSDMSSRSYNTRALILETVDLVKSGVLMLDLECNGLISEMFQHFLSSIRDFHPQNIFISMESIMTLVLKESYDDSLSLDLSALILASLKKNNQEISTSARKLGENVLAKCAVKLKPYLKQAVKSLGLPLDGYSDIVATICNESSGQADHDSGNVSLQKQKPEAAELVSKPFHHGDKIVAIQKNDRAADDFCSQNFGQISAKPDAAELVNKLLGHNKIVAKDQNDRAAGGTAMPASKRKRDSTTEDIQTEIDNTAFVDNAPAPGAKSQSQSKTTNSKRTTKSKNDDEQCSKLEETIGILAGVLKDMVDNKKQSQSKTTTSKRTTKSKNDDEHSSKLKETMGILAGALKDMVDNKKLPIPVDELWGFIHEMKLDEDLAGDAFVFLLERPVQLKGLISTPIGMRKSILLKMMLRDGK